MTVQEGSVLCRRYRLQKLIGRGGMADVYLAFDEERQASVAIKVLHGHLAADPELLRRFRDEAAALERLDHPGIVRLYGLEEADGQAFIVMEYVAGTTLRELLEERPGPFELAAATRIFHDLCGALHYAHRKGIVHQDLKPANVIWTPDGRAVLADFGIAHALGSAGVSELAMGTPAYMSPEQIRGEPVGAAADIYSLGVLLYEMVTGRRPFTGSEPGLAGTDTAGRLQEAHLSLPAPDPGRYKAGLPPKAGAVLLRALAKRPDDRWPDVLSFRTAWDAAVGAKADAVQMRWEEGRSPGRPPGSSAARRGLWGLGLVLGAAVALAAAGYMAVSLWQRGAPSASTPLGGMETATEPPSSRSAPSLPTASPRAKPAQGGGVVVVGGSEAPAGSTATLVSLAGSGQGSAAVLTRPVAAPTLAPTFTPAPAETSIPTAIAAPAPTFAPSPTRRATATATPRRGNTVGDVILLWPEANTTLQGRVIFARQNMAGFSLGPGEQYELVFWLAGQDGLRDGRSPVGASTDTLVSVDMAIVEQLFGRSARQLMWGVRLWGPTGAVRMLSEGQPFIVAFPGEKGAPKPIGDW